MFRGGVAMYSKCETNVAALEINLLKPLVHYTDVELLDDTLIYPRHDRTVSVEKLDLSR